MLLVGGNPSRGTYEATMEMYSPAYLFNADGTDAVRPAITGVTPAFGYGAMFDVQTPDASDVRSVVLVRPGAQTHAFDMDQRLIELSFTSRRERFARHRAPQRQHRATRLLPAVHPEFRGRAVGRHLRTTLCIDSQSGAHGDDHAVLQRT